MKKLLVIKHVSHEILGTLNSLFKKSGFQIHFLNFGRHPNEKPKLEGYNSLVILGGPMGVYQTEKYSFLKTEIGLIQHAIDLQIPVLGICLGAQLVAKALGAEVRPGSKKEIGWYPVSLTKEGKRDSMMSHFNCKENIFQWHGDTFEIPKGALQLAESSIFKNQAFRYGKNIYGFQFHLEVDEPMIERWLRVPVMKKEIESLNGKINPERIRRDTLRFIDRLKNLSEITFAEFIKLTR